MLIKQIVKKINDKNVPTKFYNFDEAFIPKYLAYINVISDEERELYNNYSNKIDFISKSGAVYFPYMSVDIFAETQKKYDEVGYKLTVSKIKTIIDIDTSYEEKLAFSIYVILHEFGHWFHFEEMGKRPYLFGQQDLELRKVVFDKQKKLANNILSSTDNDIKAKLFYEYNSIPMEKRANDFADEHLKQYMISIMKEKNQ